METGIASERENELCRLKRNRCFWIKPLWERLWVREHMKKSREYLHMCMLVCERARMCIFEAGLNMLSVSRVGMCTRQPLLFKQPASSPSPWQRALQQRLPRQQWNRGAGGGGSQEVRAAVERPLYKTLASRSNSICVSVCAVHPYVCMCRVYVCSWESAGERVALH